MCVCVRAYVLDCAAYACVAEPLKSIIWWPFIVLIKIRVYLNIYYLKNKPLTLVHSNQSVNTTTHIYLLFRNNKKNTLKLKAFLWQNMADEELLDYEEEEQQNENKVESEPKKDIKGTYVSIHSSGFKDFLLKPELLRAIMDCGFEHPSEGTSTHLISNCHHNYIQPLTKKMFY